MSNIVSFPPARAAATPFTAVSDNLLEAANRIGVAASNLKEAGGRAACDASFAALAEAVRLLQMVAYLAEIAAPDDLTESRTNQNA